ncbi:hypothetical protein B566_EDAN014262 [Ephemera danica]|nr:hypothetical protein B566_EDAN014262 [Ephemera danica]
MELRLFEPFGENVDFHYGDIVNPSVIASYKPIQNMRTYPEVQCTEEFKTLRPGQITCPRGKATVSRPPSCVAIYSSTMRGITYWSEVQQRGGWAVQRHKDLLLFEFLHASERLLPGRWNVERYESYLFKNSLPRYLKFLTEFVTHSGI